MANEASADVILGSGPFRYRVLPQWGELPQGWRYGDVAAVGVDRKDNVYVFNRGPHPVIVYDREGRFLRSWGEGVFKRAHGLHMGPDDTVYLTDDGDHTVRHCRLDGTVLMTIGIPGRPSSFMSGLPFHRCTHTALSPKGEIYIADGYGNACVHKYSPDGKLLFSWGEPGTDPGEFNIVHNICCDGEGWVYVADRENHRVQVFDGEGKYEAQWNNLHRPCGLYMESGKNPLCFIGELGPGYPINRDAPNLGPRISILTSEGKLLARLGRMHAGEAVGQFIAPHGLAIDSHGDLYVGEVSNTAWPQVYPPIDPPRELRCLQKLVKLS
ncbi:MAG TPA: peptidyl-alpha-hydroxyglycine alpha-amidating lyase family protein [Stellaceae bacterium]|nr:peptidyl-alpha-hydroxyglycine alpha-amidating lyase family protein [Stellaceae bacterium]